MVGAGTGCSAFRAFMQHREAANQKGKTWLFFGERRFFSTSLPGGMAEILKKDISKKLIWPFHAIRKRKSMYSIVWRKTAEIFNWLENGASFYCARYELHGERCSEHTA
jgi:sulfite reductase (NADPH) flavoprotein alpha-component